MANTINWGKSYSESYWGNATSTIDWADVYQIEYYTPDLNRRVQIYENNTMTIQLLENLEDC